MTRAILVLLLALTSGWVRADSIQPPELRPPTADSLRRQLWRMPASRVRVDVLLRLANDYINYYTTSSLLDSADSYSRQALSLSWQLRYVRGQIESAYATGNLALRRSQLPEGRLWLRQGLLQSQKAHVSRLEADGWYYLAMMPDFSTAALPQRINYLQHAQGLYQAQHCGIEATHVLKIIADLHFQQGHESLARTELLDVLARYRALDYTRLHYTYESLDKVDMKTGNFKEALQFGLAAIRSARVTGDTTDIDTYYLRVGYIYMSLKLLPDALAAFQFELKRTERDGNIPYAIATVMPLTQTLIRLNRPKEALALALRKLNVKGLNIGDQLNAWYTLGTCYLADHQLTLAEQYQLRVLRQLEGDQNSLVYINMITYASLEMVRIYVAMHRYNEARQYLDKTFVLRNSLNISQQATLLLLAFKVDSAQRHYLAAIADQQRLQIVHDSIFNDTQVKQIASLKIQYETRQKEQSLALLTKQNLVQRANIRQREQQRNALLLGVALLALLLGLGYNRYQLKQRSNRLLEAQRQEIASQNQTLEKVLDEKNSLLEQNEWMLKEIHHRVKNNLQIIGSLLRSQSVYLQDKAARAAVRESRNRVHSMALIHQKLYQSHHLAGVPIDTYIREIVDHLLASFDCPPGIQTELSVAPVELDVALAVPVGLILNEAITNSLKYAFPSGQDGHLFIGFDALTADCYQLTVRDNGVGFGADFAPERCRTLGLSLIQGLSKQIGGHLHVQGTNGVHIALNFKQLA